MPEGVTILSEEEAAQLNQVINQNLGMLDNPAVNHLINSPQLSNRTDKRSRPIISKRQLLGMRDNGMSLAGYMVQICDRSGRIATVPAEKISKWVHMGSEYRHVEDYQAEQEEKEVLAEKLMDIRQKNKAMRDQHGQDIEVFYCNVKYPDCERFFDSALSRSTHWGMQHGEKKKAKKDGK